MICVDSVAHSSPEQVRPRGAWLTVNRACNLRCLWCYAKGTSYGPQGMMSFELAKSLVLLLNNLKVSHIQLIGGEPTLWPHLFETNNLTNQSGIKTTIITNAMRFGDDRFWEEYQNSPNTSAGISVKASNAEDLLEVAGIGDFKKMVLGIKRGLQFFQCGVGMTYNTYYTEKLIDLAKFSVDNGAKSIKVDFCSTVFESGTAVNCHMVEPTEIVRKIMRDYDRLTEITGGRLVFEMNMPLCLWPADFIQHLIEHDQILTVCHVLKRQGIIFDTEGKVLMCNGLFDYPIGQFGADFDDAESLTKFLNKPEVSFFYEQISAFPSEKCQTCEVYNLCGGGCPLKWAVYKPHEMISGYHGKTLTVRKEGGEQHECSVA